MNQLKAIKLDASHGSYEYIGNILSMPYIWRRLSDDVGCFTGLLKLIDMLRVGYYHFYVPMMDKVPIGLCWGWKETETQFLGHLCFYKDFWGEHAKAGFEKCIDICKEDLGVKEIISYIPIDNTVVKQFCLSCGFEERGIGDNVFIKDGKDIPCNEIIKIL